MNTSLKVLSVILPNILSKIFASFCLSVFPAFYSFPSVCLKVKTNFYITRPKDVIINSVLQCFCCASLLSFLAKHLFKACLISLIMLILILLILILLILISKHDCYASHYCTRLCNVSMCIQFTSEGHVSVLNSLIIWKQPF